MILILMLWFPRMNAVTSLLRTNECVKVHKAYADGTNTSFLKLSNCNEVRATRVRPTCGGSSGGDKDVSGSRGHVGARRDTNADNCIAKQTSGGNDERRIQNAGEGSRSLMET